MIAPFVSTSLFFSTSFGAAFLLAASAAPSVAQDSTARAKELFVKNCATCHGETGDGKGATQLDRPARSFMDGGFSFGNTPEALFRTISTGIPGTPMPGFDSSLSEEERRLVASHVVTLGPPIEEVKEEDMVLDVRERPLIVRGLLPSLGEGLPAHPRGLLVGDPSGITFEYRVDDVRLLALRQGGFVKRTDWTGRGGTPLEPLGKVVHLVEGGRPRATFSLAGGAIPLAARLSGTRVEKERVTVEYHLVRDGIEVAHVAESPRVFATPLGTGFVRHFEIRGGQRPVHLALADPTQGPGTLELRMEGGDAYGAVNPTEHGSSYHVISLGAERWSRRDGVAIVDIEPGAAATIELLSIPALVPDAGAKLSIVAALQDVLR
jgi:mono/diheme cytochrome c family protein